VQPDGQDGTSSASGPSLQGPWRRRQIKNLAVLAFMVFAACFTLGGTMVFKQESFIYFPDRILVATPRDAGISYEELSLRTEDGVRLGAWWVPAERARGTLILCHGNAGNISHRLHLIGPLHGLGLNVLAFDYRGYGQSEGSPSEEGTYRDMDAAVTYALSRNGDPERLVFFGESLGGAVAVESATRHPCAALVLESSFISVAAMAKRHYPWLPSKLPLRIRYDSLARIKGVACPVLVMHGPQDEIVPFSMGQALYDAARGPKIFVALAGGHNDGGVAASPEAMAALRRFLDRTLGEKE
jgi:fermentation-respiration switch protein FrsA (DUF1100 family)